MSTQPYPQQSYPMETYPGYRQPPTQQPQPHRPPRKQNTTMIAVGVLIIVVIVLIAVGFYFVLLPHAEVTIRVNNDHWTSVTYDLYVDDTKMLNDVFIPPSHYDEETIRVNLKSRGCDSYDFYVVATDILDWSYTDSTTVTLCNGEKTTVELNPF